MTVQPQSEPISEPAACPLCGVQVARADQRCAACGHTLAGVVGHQPAWSRSILVLTIVVFAALYLATVAIVAVTR